MRVAASGLTGGRALCTLGGLDSDRGGPILAHTAFTPEGFRAFRDNDRPGPIQMLNFVRWSYNGQTERGTGE